MTGEKIGDILADLEDQIEDLNMSAVGTGAGYGQAVAELRASLDALDQAVAERDFEKASSIGYKETASAFVFLQRVLGLFQQLESNKHILIQDVALRHTGVYEEAEPHVMEKLNCFRLLENQPD